jgi:hypothetical protein
MKRKKPVAAEDYYQMIQEYAELIRKGEIEWGEELSIAEHIDVFQYHFIDQWEQHESSS